MIAPARPQFSPGMLNCLHGQWTAQPDRCSSASTALRATGCRRALTHRTRDAEVLRCLLIGQYSLAANGPLARTAAMCYLSASSGVDDAAFSISSRVVTMVRAVGNAGLRAVHPLCSVSPWRVRRQTCPLTSLLTLREWARCLGQAGWAACDRSSSCGRLIYLQVYIACITAARGGGANVAAGEGEGAAAVSPTTDWRADTSSSRHTTRRHRSTFSYSSHNRREERWRRAAMCRDAAYNPITSCSCVSTGIQRWLHVKGQVMQRMRPAALSAGTA